MHTLNVRQLRSLAFVAPGTLALAQDNFADVLFITAEDDRIRSNVWGVRVDRDGNIALLTDSGPDIFRTYDDLMRTQREIILEEEAELSALASLGD